MELEVSRDVMVQLVAHANAAAPNECCGILFGAGERIMDIRATANVHQSPQTGFEIDPQSLIDAHRNARSGGARVIGYFHSHPNGIPGPSVTDQALAARDNSVWAIIAGEQVTFWRDGDEGFAALPYRIVER